jgi:hypothetical protein
MNQSDKWHEAMEARSAGKAPQLLCSWRAPYAREIAAKVQHVRRITREPKTGRTLSYERVEPRVPQVGDEFDSSSITEYGSVDVVLGTGRATCRHCGQKIKKGEEALKFHHDFTGSGSWTAQSVQIHRTPCEYPTK